MRHLFFPDSFSSLKQNSQNVIFNLAICLILYCSINFFPGSFQTDKPMARFLVETLEELLHNFYANFSRLEVFANAKITTSLLKIDVSNCANQLSTSKIDVSFSLKYLHQLKIIGEITYRQIDKFKRKICDFLVSMCGCIIEENPLSSFLAHSLKSVSLSFTVEIPEKCEYLFDKLLMKLVTYKKTAASVAV